MVGAATAGVAAGTTAGLITAGFVTAGAAIAAGDAVAGLAVVGAAAGPVAAAAPAAANQLFTPLWPEHAPLFVAFVVYEPSLQSPVEPAGAAPGACASAAVDTTHHAPIEAMLRKSAISMLHE